MRPRAVVTAEFSVKVIVNEFVKACCSGPEDKDDDDEDDHDDHDDHDHDDGR